MPGTFLKISHERVFQMCNWETVSDLVCKRRHRSAELTMMPIIIHLKRQTLSKITVSHKPKRFQKGLKKDELIWLRFGFNLGRWVKVNKANLRIRPAKVGQDETGKLKVKNNFFWGNIFLWHCWYLSEAKGRGIVLRECLYNVFAFCIYRTFNRYMSAKNS